MKKANILSFFLQISPYPNVLAGLAETQKESPDIAARALPYIILNKVYPYYFTCRPFML